jgi:hypothetical protein
VSVNLNPVSVVGIYSVAIPVVNTLESQVVVKRWISCDLDHVGAVGIIDGINIKSRYVDKYVSLSMVCTIHTMGGHSKIISKITKQLTVWAVH